MGDEYEFYQGEVKDLVLAVLTDTLSKINPDSRRMDIVRDVIENNDYQGLSDKKRMRLST